MCETAPDFSCVLPDAMESPSTARRLVHQHSCPTHGLEVSDALALVTSELVTNAVLYGSAPISLQLFCHQDEVVLSVEDSGLGLPGDGGRSQGLGEGLNIVAHLSSSWGTTPLTVGKAVWCRLPTGIGLTPAGEAAG